MRLKPRPLFLTAIAALSLSACNPVPSSKSEQFWQKKNVSEAIYAQGPKAQQMLNRDIARCVFELQELERLGVTKNAIPTNVYGMTLDPDEQRLRDHDTPERDQNLLAEHYDYLDFEGCMADKGWERTKSVPFVVAAWGRENYKRAHIELSKRPDDAKAKSTVTSNDTGDYGGVNR
jgi:hypothetical protein